MCRLQNIAMCDYQESVTTGQTHRQTHIQTPDKVIPMCRYALQATQKLEKTVSYMTQMWGYTCISVHADVRIRVSLMMTSRVDSWKII